MFVKFQGLGEMGGGSPFAWGRADIDQAPYRGPQLPLLKNEEAESLLERAVDCFHGTFDTSLPDQRIYGHTLQEIIDRKGNGWYTIRSWNEHWGEKAGIPTMFVFVVWEYPYMAPKNNYVSQAANFIQFRQGSTNA